MKAINPKDPDFYIKVYDYAFKDMAGTMKFSYAKNNDNTCTCLLEGKYPKWQQYDYFLHTHSIWFGPKPSLPHVPHLMQLKVVIPQNALPSDCTTTNSPALVNDCGDIAKAIVGKTICDNAKAWNGITITFGYDVETLLDVNSLEEMLIMMDLN